MSEASSAIQFLSDQAYLEGHNVKGILLIKLDDNEILYNQNVKDPLKTATTCLELWNCSVKLKEDDESPVKLIRLRSDADELFLISDEIYLLMAKVDL